MLQIAMPNVVKPVYEQSDFLCYLTYGLLMTFSIVNILTMAIMAVTRYLHISNSKYYKFVTLKSNFIFMGCGWIIALSLSMPPTFQIWGNFQYFPVGGICIISFAKADSFSGMSYVLTLMTVSYLIPTVIISICYYKIYLIVRASKERVHIYSRRKSFCRQQSYREKDIRLSITIFMIFVTFIISYAPFVIFNFLELIGAVSLNLKDKFFAKYFTFINCSLNPVIFSLRTRRVRRFLSNFKSNKSTPIRPIEVLYSAQYSSRK
ncbi:Melatonin receptor type 1C [Trichoplax sp. H2]|nr:Melatonin receptor type 1C [Trichoplax sp. H2]|eukprot:RDD41301.1 Melatonin receptor type 1C [Trichoplax sp. H2]